MRPLKEMPDSLLESIGFILCDIDDTLTHDGLLPPDSFASLHRLNDDGFHVIPITGRPAGWCDHIARFWPVEGIVGENGAFYFQYDRHLRRMNRNYWKDPNQRQQDQVRMDKVRDAILSKVPGSALSADQSYRDSDLAIDFCEDVPRLDDEAVTRIVEIFHAHGAKAKVSSIHVNGWFGDYDKCSMSLLMLSRVFGISQEEAKSKVLFIGDSPNDCPMFEAFPVSVGVANVLDYKKRLNPVPAWITKKRGGFGFTELTEFLVSSW